MVIGATLLYSDPPVFAHFVVFSFVILIDRGHLLSGEKDEGVEDKVQVLTCLLHMDFLKSFHEDVALCRVRACDGENGKWLSTTCEVNTLIQ